ncbi:hypothetical protein [Maridesulfovibrio bastinii]|uniref:hypothetical protein n=1 Tax=Maridesulfovibrio bastinii TaxID=47157 RepID=UPI00042A7E9C|nr:hypothetical protein [Maridesulfovibrio bastinii]
MSNDDKLNAVETWELMQCAKEKLGAKELQKIFQRGQTQINRYCSSPISEDHQRNPLDRIHILFSNLCEAGGEEIVRASINHFADIIGCRVAEQGEIVPDKDTVEEECLDDYPEKVAMDNMIAASEHPEKVRRQGEKTCREIMETVISYETHWGKLHNQS